MTFLEMYNLSNLLLDKAGTAYFLESEFDSFCNIAYNDWIEREYEKLEQSQEHTVKLKPLYGSFRKLGSDVINFSTDVLNFRYLIRFNGKFNDVCGGVTTVLTSNINKALNNNIDVLNIDPFNKPIAREPLYIQTIESGIVVFKVYPFPNEINMTYIKEPQIINSAGSPSTVFEMPNYIAEEIVQLCVKKQDVNIGNFNKVQFDQNEIVQRNGVFE